MIFTKYHGSEVAGLVFVDAAHPDQTDRLTAAIGHPEDGHPRSVQSPAAPDLDGLAAAPDSRADRAGTTARRRRRNRCLPARLAGRLIRRSRRHGEPRCAEAGTFRDLGDRPLAVLSRGKPWSAYSETERAGTGLTRDQFDRMQQAWSEMQVEEASWSTRSTHRTLDDSSHVIQLERPDAVVDAIRTVVSQVRARNAESPR